jgi:hypothetical protein
VEGCEKVGRRPDPDVWRVSRSDDGTVLGFRLRNPDAPNGAGDFSMALLRRNGRLRLVARRSGLEMGAAQGRVGIGIRLRQSPTTRTLCSARSKTRSISRLD